MGFDPSDFKLAKVAALVVVATAAGRMTQGFQYDAVPFFRGGPGQETTAAPGRSDSPVHDEP